MNLKRGGKSWPRAGWTALRVFLIEEHVTLAAQDAAHTAAPGARNLSILRNLVSPVRVALLSCKTLTHIPLRDAKCLGYTAQAHWRISAYANDEETMSLRVSVNQLQQQLPELLDRTVAANDVCLIERNGQPYAVLVSIREWKRQTIGKQLDALGPSYRLGSAQQKRTEELLAKQETSRLTRLEQRELNDLLQESEAVMLRRAEALERV